MYECFVQVYTEISIFNKLLIADLQVLFYSKLFQSLFRDYCFKQEISRCVEIWIAQIN